MKTTLFPSQKTKRKVIATALAIALILPVIPYKNTDAAAKITLKSGAAAPSNVYAGHSYTLKVAGTKVNFYSPNKKVATIGRTTGKLKPVKPGSVKITAKSKKTGKAVACKTFKVLQRSKSVSVEKAKITLAPKETAVIKASLTPDTSTDIIRFVSTNKSVATVGQVSGKITAVNEGTCTINVYAKATKATSNKVKANKTTSVTVTVKKAVTPADPTKEPLNPTSTPTAALIASPTIKPTAVPTDTPATTETSAVTETPVKTETPIPVISEAPTLPPVISEAPVISKAPVISESPSTAPTVEPSETPAATEIVPSEEPAESEIPSTPPTVEPSEAPAVSETPESPTPGASITSTQNSWLTKKESNCGCRTLLYRRQCGAYGISLNKWI